MSRDAQQGDDLRGKVSSSDGGTVITRIWRAQATRDSAPAYLRYVTEQVFPALWRIDGYLGARVLRREIGDRVELLVLTHWDSWDAIRAFAGADPEVAVVEPEARRALTEFDSTVTHFEVAYDSVESLMRPV